MPINNAVAIALRQMVEAINKSDIDAFTQEYALSSEEGVVLMCLAEALLRVPDADTQDRLIRDKIAGRAWERHRGHSQYGGVLLRVYAPSGGAQVR